MPPITLWDVLPELDHDRPIGMVLADAVNRHHLIQVGRFSDEEMAALAGRVEPHASPWLSMIDPDLHAQAINEGRLSLTKDGRAAFTGDQLTATAGHVGPMVWARSNVDGVATIDIEAGGDIEARVLLYRSHPDLFLVELIGPLGFHDFAFANTATVSQWLVDVSRVEATIDEELLADPSDADLLVAKVEELGARAERATSVYVEDQAGPRQFVIYLVEDEVWLCEHLNATADSVEVRLRRTGAKQLPRYIAHAVGPLPLGPAMNARP